jgi:hypothetical protein
METQKLMQKCGAEKRDRDSHSVHVPVFFYPLARPAGHRTRCREIYLFGLCAPVGKFETGWN